MRKFLTFIAAVFGLSLLLEPTNAAVLLTFDTDSQGFTAVGWNAGNGNAAWSANHGGSLAINSSMGAGWTNPLAQLSMTGTPEMAAEFQLALTNGGTLEFDYIVDSASFANLNNANLGWFELVATANSDGNAGGGWDQNVLTSSGFYGGVPTGVTTRRISVNIAAGPPVANNNTLTFGVGSGWNELLLGINSGDSANTPYTSTTVYIDNVTLTAVPEPASAAALACAAIAGGLRWRRSRKSA